MPSGPTRAKAFKMGVNNLVKLLADTFGEFHEFWRNEADVQPQRLTKDPGRLASDEFFEEVQLFSSDYQKGLEGSSSDDVIRNNYYLHLAKTLEQDHNLRYNSSRRHAIRAASNNARRIHRDLENLSKVNYKA